MEEEIENKKRAIFDALDHLIPGFDSFNPFKKKLF